MKLFGRRKEYEPITNYIFSWLPINNKQVRSITLLVAAKFGPYRVVAGCRIRRFVWQRLPRVYPRFEFWNQDKLDAWMRGER